MRRSLAILISAMLIAVTGVFVMSGVASASCATNHITLYIDANGGGGHAQTFCLESGNQPNLNNIPGPCPQFLHADSWNDCVSSVRVTLGLTQCFALYTNANYNGLMVTYWGAIGPDTLFNLPVNDALSSMKQYTKSPATPNGNC
jgi:hypothetical protein